MKATTPSIHSRWLSLPLLMGLMTITGCGASFSFHYGKPPIVPHSGDQSTRCAFRKKITIRRAGLSWHDTSYFNAFDAHVVLITEGQLKGLSFFQGDKLVSADSVLNVIKDPDLVIAYRKLYIKDKRSQQVARTVGWIGMGTALASTVIGTSLIFDQYVNGRRSAQMYAGIGFLSLAVVGYVVGIIELVMAADHSNTVQAYERMFLARSYESRMIKAVEEYNIQAASECSGSAPPE